MALSSVSTEVDSQTGLTFDELHHLDVVRMRNEGPVNLQDSNDQKHNQNLVYYKIQPLLSINTTHTIIIPTTCNNSTVLSIFFLQ